LKYPNKSWSEARSTPATSLLQRRAVRRHCLAKVPTHRSAIRWLMCGISRAARPRRRGSCLVRIGTPRTYAEHDSARQRWACRTPERCT